MEAKLLSIRWHVLHPIIPSDHHNHHSELASHVSQRPLSFTDSWVLACPYTHWLFDNASESSDNEYCCIG